MFFLGYMILLVMFVILFFAVSDQAGETSTAATVLAVLAGLTVLGLVVPSIAVQVRRFHDQDKSGWMILLALIPSVVGIIILVFMCLSGTNGPNRYGDDPVNPDGHLNDVFQ